MPNTCVLRVGRIVATVLVVTWACRAQVAWGQTSPGGVTSNGLLPLLNSQPAANPNSNALYYQQPMNMPRRADGSAHSES